MRLTWEYLAQQCPARMEEESFPRHTQAALAGPDFYRFSVGLLLFLIQTNLVFDTDIIHELNLV